MFAIHAPQSITLTEPGEDAFTLINFRVAGADTSRCVMEIVTPDGDTHRLTFNQRGLMVDQQFIGHDSAPEGESHQLGASDYIVDGRDTRADNPYTHVAPATHGDPVIDAGGLQPDVFNHDGSPAVTPEMAEQARSNAEAAAKGCNHDGVNEENYEKREHEEATTPMGSDALVPETFTTSTSPGPNPFESAPPIRNRMTPQDPVHGRVNTTESLRNG